MASSSVGAHIIGVTQATLALTCLADGDAPLGEGGLVVGDPVDAPPRGR